MENSFQQSINLSTDFCWMNCPRGIFWGNFTSQCDISELVFKQRALLKSLGTTDLRSWFFMLTQKINDRHFRSELFMKVILILNGLLFEIWQLSSTHVFNFSFFFPKSKQKIIAIFPIKNNVTSLIRVDEIVVIKPSGRNKLDNFCQSYS